MSDASYPISKDDEASFGDYFALLKPRVMSLVVFTAFVGLLAAPASVNPFVGFCAILFIAVGGGASGALNMWWDADIDAKMRRTAGRPIPDGRMAAGEALAFGLALAVLSVMMLAVFAFLPTPNCQRQNAVVHTGLAPKKSVAPEFSPASQKLAGWRSASRVRVLPL